MDGHFAGFAANNSNGAGLGLSTGLTPRGMGLTPVGMQLTGSNSAGVVQDQEEERRRRVEVIVALVAGKWGFVSQEGVERCAKRLGLECLWEEGMGEGRKRTLTIAGHGVLVDVEFWGEGVGGVVLSFPGSSEGVERSAGVGAGVLKRVLKGEDGGYVRLDGFVENMEMLGRMDRLGGEKVNCFEAVDGVFRSLERVFAWEVHREVSKSKRGEEEVLCRASGRPRMHTRGRVGLAIQYWMDRRLVLGKATTVDAMEVDTKPDDEADADTDIWSAMIECEPSSSELYPSTRVSDAWVSVAIEKPASTDTNDLTAETSPIDWQEPPQTLIAQEEPAENGPTTESTLLPQPKPPDVRFVAKFEPPVIVPLQTAHQLHQSVGLQIPQESILPTTYESLLFADIDVYNPQPSSSPCVVEKCVRCYDPATATSASNIHKYTLFAQPQEWARAITHLPFSHPKQIVAILPTLRQWTLVGCILRRAFVVDAGEVSPTALTNGDEIDSEPPRFQTVEAELEAFMASPLPTEPKPASSKIKDIQVSFKAVPFPHFNISFINPRHGGKLAELSFMVGLNGVIEGVDVHDGSPDWGGSGNGDLGVEKVKERVRLREKVKRVLEIGESVGIAVEWMSR